MRKFIPVASQSKDIDIWAVAAQVPVAWSVVDLDGTQLMGNHVYADLFGMTMEEMLGKNVRELTHPDDLERTDAYLQWLVSGEVDRYETDKRYRRPDGSTFVGHLIASLLRDPAGAPQALVGVIDDVTEARNTGRRLARTEERLSKMLSNISDTVTLLDENGTVVGSTGFQREVLGHPSDFWWTRSVLDLVHPAEQARAAALMDRARASAAVEYREEFQVRHERGHYEEIEVTVVNLVDDPAVEALVLTSRNITDRKAADRALAGMRDDAVALAEQRSRFLAAASHELRTPLHAVLGLTELLAATSTDDEASGLIGRVHSEAERLRRTVDDLLDHARLEAEGLRLAAAPVEVASVTNRVVERVRATAHAAGLLVECRIGPDVPPVVEVDEHRLDQVLTNLMGNAVKFTSEGSVVLTVRARGERLLLAVADTGPGIPENERAQVFEPFIRVGGPIAAVEGTGLGLTLVRDLVQQMDGTVELRCPAEGGSVFTVGVPLVLAELAPDVARSTTTDTPPARVLVVEDNEINQMIVRGQLRQLGHDAMVVASAVVGLDLLGRPDHGFDLVLMDWQLPEIDGLEATRRLRLREADGDHIPVIAMTANAMPDDRAACLAAGMDDFLGKPVSLADLGRMIARWAHGAPGAAGALVEVDEASIGVLDLDVLGRLQTELGDDDLVVSLAHRYLDELGGRRAVLDQAVASGDLEAAHRLGHTLRSTSEMLGLHDTRDACRALEGCDDVDDLSAAVATFAVATARGADALRTWLDGR